MHAAEDTSNSDGVQPAVDTSTTDDCGVTMSRAAGELLRRVLMVPPQHFTVTYSINPWMGGVVDKAKAFTQWNALKTAIEAEGVEVLTLDQDPKLPDMVFVCNSGLVHQNNVYVSKFAHKERTGEQAPYLEWFKKHGFKIHGDDYADRFEGGGDAVFSSPDVLWAGFGPRSCEKVYSRIASLGSFDLVKCELASDKFYHLDTCFAPLDDKTALWYPPAFSAATQKEILRRLPNSIAVTDEEAKAFICNAICVRRSVLSPIGVGSGTRRALLDAGFKLVEIDMSEFMKSGGACQCLVLRL